MFKTLLLISALLVSVPALAQPITVTDTARRVVTLPGPAQRIVLAEARQLVALSIVDRDGANSVVGMADLLRFDKEVREDYLAQFPNLRDVPALDGDRILSAEKTIAVEPDLVIMSGGTGPDAAQLNLVATLEAAGIPSVFIDFRSDPFKNTVPSIALLGAVTGNVETANAFVALYNSHRDAILARIAETAPQRPTVFMHMQARNGDELMAPGAANLGTFIEAAGGDNIGAGIVPGMFGALSTEYVLSLDPDIYIGTGGTHFAGGDGVVVGPDVSFETAEQSLQALAADPIISELSAVRAGNAHGLWHNFHNSPLNIVALEVLASWIHPELFGDMDPQATLDEINSTFFAVPFIGTAWVSLPSQR